MPFNENDFNTHEINPAYICTLSTLIAMFVKCEVNTKLLIQ